MPQMTIGGKSEGEKKKEQSLEKKLNFQQRHKKELEEIKEKIEEGVIKEEWTHKWWYCNRIEGYPTPPDKSSGKHYTQSPTSEYQGEMREFRTVDYTFDKEYALKRLEIAIENYGERIQELQEEMDDKEARW